MLKRGMVYIVTDETKIIEECYSEAIQKSHLPALQSFSDKYNLGYHFKPTQYEEAPRILALDGNFVIKTLEDESVAFFYIPMKVTERQLMWFYQNKSKFEKYGFVHGGDVFGDKEDVKINEVSGLDNIWTILNRNYKNNGHKRT